MGAGKHVHLPNTDKKNPKKCKYFCEYCNETFEKIEKLQNHENNLHHLKTLRVAATSEYVTYKSAFKNRIENIFVNNPKYKDFDKFFKYLTRIWRQIGVTSPVKLNILVIASYEKKSVGEKKSLKLQSKNVNCYPEDSTEKLEIIYADLKKRHEQIMENGSEWTLDEIEFAEFHINKYNPLYGGSSSYVDLPDWIKNKKACINVRNTDNCCFKYSILCKEFDIQKDAQRISKYKNLQSKYDFSNVSYPTSLNDVKKFSKKNNISINVYTLMKKPQENCAVAATMEEEIVPLIVCKEEKLEHCDLLYLKNSEYGHYVYIKDLSRLLNSGISKNCKKLDYICKCCLCHFINQELLLRHKEYCNAQRIQDPVRVHLPRFGENILRFKEQQYTHKIDYVIYADLECILKPITNEDMKTFGSASSRLHEHVPISYCYYVVDKGYSNNPVIYTAQSADENIMYRFLDDLKHEARKIYSKLRRKRDIRQMIPLTEAQLQEFNTIKNCPGCGTHFNSANRPRRHHCHVTGAYLKPLCNNCNLNTKIQYFIPVIFHNMRGYDGHFVVTSIDIDSEHVDIIPSTHEKYTTISKTVRVDPDNNKATINLRFIDSFQFLNSSLETLSQNLPNNLKHHLNFHVADVEKRQLLCQKGIFPYTYLSDHSKLSDVDVPPIEKFYNDLKKEHISEEEYQHVQHVWTTFNCTNLQDYLEVYLLTDVLLLADIFENFREQSLTHYELDPAHFVSTPSLSWLSMLKKTEVELELLCDIDMYLMLEQNIRGGICHVGKRYARANNPYMIGSGDKEWEYDPQQETSYITYYDQNSLYANAMSHYLPQRNFKWLSQEEIANLDIMSVGKDAETGYILEVDLEYPSEIHESHKDYPFCAEKQVPPDGKAKVAKLLCTLEDKEKYVIHYMTLQCALEHGLRLKKIHRVISFTQSPWLKTYIDINIELRKQAKNKFETDYFKLLNNSIFGRSIMNLRKFLKAKLVLNEKQYSRAVKKVNFAKSTIFNENIALMEFYKCNLLLKMPVYLGFSILDISKTIQYNWFYKEAPIIFHNFNYSMMYTDTDSFILYLTAKNGENSDVYKNVRHFREKFDLSNFPPSHQCHFTENARQLNKMKDEYAGKIIVEVVALRPKMYSIKTLDRKEMKKCKGIQESVVSKQITHQDYLDCLFENETFQHVQTNIHAFKHKLYTIEQQKTSLTNNDDKRIILDDGIGTIPYGYRAPTTTTT